MSNNQSDTFLVEKYEGVEITVSHDGYFRASIDGTDLVESTKSGLQAKIDRQLKAKARREAEAARRKVTKVPLKLLRDSGQFEEFSFVGYKTRGTVAYDKGFVVEHKDGEKMNLPARGFFQRGSAKHDDLTRLAAICFEVSALQKEKAEILKRVAKQYDVPYVPGYNPSQEQLEQAEAELIASIRAATHS